MKVSGVEKKEKSAVELAVEFSVEEFEEALNKAYRKNRGSIMIPGFRKGKAPRKMIERMYGDSIFYEDAVQILSPGAFSKAVEEEKLNIVGQPVIDDIDVSEEKILTIRFAAALYPEVTLGDYRGLAAPRKEEPVSQEELDREITAVQKRNARILTVDRPAKEGDTAVIDFEGFIDGVPFEGGKGEEHALTLGSETFVPGFEDQVVGMSADEEKDVSITFPEDYAEELAGEEAVFRVKVRRVQESVLPELDDEFAKDVSEFDTMAEYRESVEERLIKERREAADRQFQDAVMEKAVANMSAEVPDAMVEQQMDNMMQEFSYNISAQGIKPEEYLAMMGMTPESFRLTSRGPAEKRVKSELLLDKIIETETIEVTDEELDAEYKDLAERYQMEEEKLRTALPAETVTFDLKRKRAAQVIYDTAVATEPEETPDENTAADTEENVPAEELSGNEAAEKEGAED